MTAGRGRWGGLRGAVIRYRVMAFIVGTALILLVFVAIPLQYGAGVTWVAEVVAPIHGYLYLVYLVAGADLARRAHWRLGRILLVVAAGFVPFLAFIVEHRVYSQMQAELAAGAIDTGASPSPAGSPAGTRDGAATTGAAAAGPAPDGAGAGPHPPD